MITLEEKEGYLHANHDLAKAKTLNLKTSQNYALICQIVKGPEERSPSISKIKPCERGIVFFSGDHHSSRKTTEGERKGASRKMNDSLACLVYFLRSGNVRTWQKVTT